jgi:hypothetical protein
MLAPIHMIALLTLAALFVTLGTAAQDHVQHVKVCACGALIQPSPALTGAVQNGALSMLIAVEEFNKGAFGAEPLSNIDNSISMPGGTRRGRRVELELLLVSLDSSPYGMSRSVNQCVRPG